MSALDERRTNGRDGGAPAVLLAALLAALALVATVAALASCSGSREGSKPPPLIVVGVDGLEWELVLRFAREGALPEITKLMGEGCCGKLETLDNSISPVVWTSIATGKRPDKHGIVNFSYSDPSGGDHLFTSVQRRNKAIWNVLTERQQVVDVFGWWCTFPVEEVSGRMVAQTTTRAQLDLSRGNVIWKGNYLAGVQHQVHPEEFAPRMDAIAQALAAKVDTSDDPMNATFGTPKRDFTPLTRKLWNAVKLSLYADVQFRDAALATLDDRQPFDAMLVYFGVTDVASHMFWRHFEPEKFAHPPSADEVADFGHVIRDAYRFVDAAIGELRRHAPPNAEFLIVSDHGFHAANVDVDFEADASGETGRADSGHHMNSPPGVFLAVGPSFTKQPVAPNATKESVRSIGNVVDVLPTLLARAGLPYGLDMDGRPLENVLSEELRRARPVTSIASWDDAAWQKSRADAAAQFGAFERKFEQQLRELGRREKDLLRKLGYTGAGIDDPPPVSRDPKDHR
jgi:hypothetical protein